MPFFIRASHRGSMRLHSASSGTATAPSSFTCKIVGRGLYNMGVSPVSPGCLASDTWLQKDGNTCRWHAESHGAILCNTRNVTKLFGSWEDSASIFLALLALQCIYHLSSATQLLCQWCCIQPLLALARLTLRLEYCDLAEVETFGLLNASIRV